MTIGDGCVYQKTFDYSLNADKLLNIKDGDLDELLKFYNITRQDMDEMIKNVREWYEKQPHLPQGQLRIDEIGNSKVKNKTFLQKNQTDETSKYRTEKPKINFEAAPKKQSTNSNDELFNYDKLYNELFCSSNS